MSIDVFLEEIDDKNFKVSFVQLNSIFECPKSNIKILCENVISCWKECMVLYNDTCDYLPFSKTLQFYNCKNKSKFTWGTVEDVQYNVFLCKI